MKLESAVNVEDQDDLYTEELVDWSNKNRMRNMKLHTQKTVRWEFIHWKLKRKTNKQNHPQTNKTKQT